MHIAGLVHSYGYWAVFVLVAIESLGIPLPGETAVILAGAYAGHTHHLNLFAILVTAIAAAFIGDNLGYLIGRHGGYRLVRRYGHKIRLDEAKLKVGRYLFDRHGMKVVFFGRFVSVLRTYAAFLAGANRMAWRRFLPANGGGGILWATVFTVGSYSAGSTIEHLSGTIQLAIACAALLTGGAVLFALRRKTARLSAQAAAAYPGPLE